MTDYIIEALIRTSIIITILKIVIIIDVLINYNYYFKYSNFDNLKICNKIYRI